MECLVKENISRHILQMNQELYSSVSSTFFFEIEKESCSRRQKNCFIAAVPSYCRVGNNSSPRDKVGTGPGTEFAAHQVDIFGHQRRRKEGLISRNFLFPKCFLGVLDERSFF